MNVLNPIRAFAGDFFTFLWPVHYRLPVGQTPAKLMGLFKRAARIRIRFASAQGIGIHVADTESAS